MEKKNCTPILVALSALLFISVIVIVVLSLSCEKSNKESHESYHSAANNLSLQSLDKAALKRLINGAPKTDLHLHIESGTNPQLAFRIAQRNNVVLGSSAWPWKTPDDLIKALDFKDLESFLLIFYAVSAAIQKPIDFQEQAENVVNTLIANNVVHAEIFFDPQTFTSRNISFKTVADNFNIGLDRGRALGLSVRLIMSVLRDSPVGKSSDTGSCLAGFPDMAHSTGWSAVKQTVDYNKQTANPMWKIIGIGLDSNEVPYPPELFSDIYQYAGQNGLFKTAHCGEEGPAAYVWTGIRETQYGGLGLARIDHGVHCGDDKNLCSYLASPVNTSGVMAAYGEPHKIPITFCPMSNYRLKVFPDPSTINIAPLLNLGVMCCVNVDDPMYTGDQNAKEMPSKWVNASWELLIDSCMETSKRIPLTFGNLKELLVNGFEASWLSRYQKMQYITKLNEYFNQNTPSLFDYLSPQVKVGF